MFKVKSQKNIIPLDEFEPAESHKLLLWPAHVIWNLECHVRGHHSSTTGWVKWPVGGWVGLLSSLFFSFIFPHWLSVFLTWLEGTLSQASLPRRDHMDDDEYAKLFRRMNPPRFFLPALSTCSFISLSTIFQPYYTYLYSCVTDRVVIDNNASDDATVIQVSFQSLLILYIYIYILSSPICLFLHVCFVILQTGW